MNSEDGQSYIGTEDDLSSAPTDEVNADFSSYTLSFTLDSACTPSYVSLNNNPQASEVSGHATVADGHKVPVRDFHKLRFATPNGTQFVL